MKLIILDRDGTINRDSDHYIKSADDWEPLPGALQAIAKLNHAGWHVVIASNQSGLGRGLFDVAALNAIHTKMHKLLAAQGARIDAVFFCPHSPDDACSCRKPAPGLFTQIGERYGMDLKGMPTCGDSVRDLQAGAAVGCEPHLVLTGKGVVHKDRIAAGHSLPPEFPGNTTVHEDLAAFASFVLAREARGKKPSTVLAAPLPLSN
jgi:D-glycero-D-manno-heptose 1,7-bisphosphate phosphatase